MTAVFVRIDLFDSIGVGVQFEAFQELSGPCNEYRPLRDETFAMGNASSIEPTRVIYFDFNGRKEKASEI